MRYPVAKVFITQKWGVNPESYARFGLKGHNSSFNEEVVELGFTVSYRNAVAKLTGRYLKHFGWNTIDQSNTKKHIDLRTIFVKYPPASLITWVNRFAVMGFSFIKLAGFNINSGIANSNIKGRTKALPFSTKQLSHKLLPSIALASFSFQPVTTLGRFIVRRFAGSISYIPSLFITLVRTVFDSATRFFNGIKPSLWYGSRAEIT